jgi:hypothetical protein
MEAQAREQDALQAAFYAWLDSRRGPEGARVVPPPAGLVAVVRRMHNHQWSWGSYNILASTTNCANDCAYCYMKPMKRRFFGADLEDFTMALDGRRVAKAWRHAEHPKLIMFPSSHDIFPQYAAEAAAVVAKMTAAGHSVLIATKPRRAAVDRLLAEFAPWPAERRARVEFRMTITSADPAVLAAWEPRASPLGERLDCLRAAREAGIQTSVSIEPYLSDPGAVAALVDADATGTVWVGELTGGGTVAGVAPEEVARVRGQYTPAATEALVDRLRGNPKIRWKTSVMRRLIRAVA